MESALKQNQGFTLVELVMVILLVTILSAFAISRSSDRQGYLNNIVINQLISAGRLAQQTALSRASYNTASANVSLNVAVVSGEWRLRIAGGDGETFDTLVEQGDERIFSGTNFSAACSSLTPAPFTINFDGDGNRSPANNLRICINSDVVTELCISPAGYIYRGACL